MIGPLIIGFPLKYTKACDKDLIWEDSEVFFLLLKNNPEAAVFFGISSTRMMT